MNAASVKNGSVDHRPGVAPAGTDRPSPGGATARGEDARRAAVVSSAAWRGATLAAAVFATDPGAFGGILLRVDAGAVAARWLALLRLLLPPGAPLRRLPPGIGEDRLLGGLDLTATLESGRPVRQRGLLEEARGGVIVVPMAERLPASTAARIVQAIDGLGVGNAAGDDSVGRLGAPAVVLLDESRDDEDRPAPALRERIAIELDLRAVRELDLDLDLDREAAPAVRRGGTRGVDARLERGSERHGLLVDREGGADTAFDSRAAGSAASPSLAGDVAAARASAHRVPATEAWIEAFCASSAALGIASLRAPLQAMRVARAVAALTGRADIDDESAAAAAAWVLAPRATQLPATDAAASEPDRPMDAPPQDGGDPSADGDAGAAEPAASDEAPPPAMAPPSSPSAEEASEASAPAPDPNGRLEDSVLAAACAAMPPALLARLSSGSTPRSKSARAGRAGSWQRSANLGAPIGARPGVPGSGARLALVDTLRAAAPWQPLRRRERALREIGAADAADRVRSTASSVSSSMPVMPPAWITPIATRIEARCGGSTGDLLRSQPIEIRRDDLRVSRRRHRRTTTTIFVVDASGSSALHRLAEAKGAVELMLAECYVRRDRVAVIAFRGAGAEVLLPPTRSLVRAKRSLAGLPGGGGTPLASGIDGAVALAVELARQGDTPTVVLLTDGRGNVARDGAPGRGKAGEDALAAARSLRGAGVAALLVDTSPFAQPLAESLAAAMGATYLPLPHARAQELSKAAGALADGGRAFRP